LLNFANHRGTKNQWRTYSTLYRYMRPATCNKTLWNFTQHTLQSLSVKLRISDSKSHTSNLKSYQQLVTCTAYTYIKLYCGWKLHLFDKTLDPKQISQLRNTYNATQAWDASCYWRGAHLKSQQVR
jgi:hypothetical protein